MLPGLPTSMKSMTSVLRAFFLSLENFSTPCFFLYRKVCCCSLFTLFLLLLFALLIFLVSSPTPPPTIVNNMTNPVGWGNFPSGRHDYVSFSTPHTTRTIYYTLVRTQRCIVLSLSGHRACAFVFVHFQWSSNVLPIIFLETKLPVPGFQLFESGLVSTNTKVDVFCSQPASRVVEYSLGFHVFVRFVFCSRPPQYRIPT